MNLAAFCRGRRKVSCTWGQSFLKGFVMRFIAAFILPAVFYTFLAVFTEYA